MRAAIYARYSTDLQSEHSIADQARLCREHAERLGAVVVEEYSDAAISGSHAHNRPGLQNLLAAAATGAFELVIAEALDRLSRDQEDIAGIHKRLAHRGVEITTIAEGHVNELHIGLKGTMNALYSKDLAAKVRRGQRGNVEQGRSPGGLAYGYDVVRDELDARGEFVRGKRRPNPDQADIVRRIFTEYISGASGRQIAAGLNADKVPGPTGGTWAASTINGNKSRRNGILWNEVYIGYLVYNRTTMVKDPDTGRRTHKLKPVCGLGDQGRTASKNHR